MALVCATHCTIRNLRWANVTAAAVRNCPLGQLVALNDYPIVIHVGQQDQCSVSLFIASCHSNQTQPPILYLRDDVAPEHTLSMATPPRNNSVLLICSHGYKLVSQLLKYVCPPLTLGLARNNEVPQTNSHGIYSPRLCVIVMRLVTLTVCPPTLAVPFDRFRKPEFALSAL